MPEVVLTQIDWYGMHSALRSETRRNMLVYLSDEGPKSHSEIADKFGLDEKSYIHYINLLLGAGVVKNQWDIYSEQILLIHSNQSHHIQEHQSKPVL